MKAIVTKQALTSGILVSEGELIPADNCYSHETLKLPGFVNYYHERGRQFHTDKATARLEVERMAVTMEKSLKKKLAKLEGKKQAALAAIEAADLS